MRAAMGHSELSKQNATGTTYAKCLNKRPQENGQQASLIFHKPLLFSMRFLDYTYFRRHHQPPPPPTGCPLQIIAPNTIFSISALHHFVMVAAKFLPNIECNAGCIFQTRQLRDASYLLSSKLFAALPPWLITLAILRLHGLPHAAAAAGEGKTRIEFSFSVAATVSSKPQRLHL